MTLIDDRPDTTPADPPGSTEPVHVLRLLNHAGDSRVTWRASNTTEVATARAAFDTARGKGHLAYRVDPDDKTKGEVMHRFDPDAEEIILAPPTVGG
jgi:hypothetical protein